MGLDGEDSSTRKPIELQPLIRDSKYVWKKWSGIRESNSRLHLGKVAYYHYTNPAYCLLPEAFIARRSRSDKCGAGTRFTARADGFRPRRRVIRCFRERLTARLINFHDARGFNDGRFLLSLGKTLGPFAINIDAAELLAVVVIDGDLPMAMLASAVALKPARTLIRFWLGTLFFHGGVALNAPDYKNLISLAQVAR